MKFLSELIVHIMTRQKLFGYDTEMIFSEASIYVVPMVNPDGVDNVSYTHLFSAIFKRTLKNIQLLSHTSCPFI